MNPFFSLRSGKPFSLVVGLTLLAFASCRSAPQGSDGAAMLTPAFNFLLPAPSESQAYELGLLYGGLVLDHARIQAMAKGFDEMARSAVSKEADRLRALLCASDSHPTARVPPLLSELEAQHTLQLLLLERRERQVARLLASESAKGGLSATTLERALDKRRTYGALVKARQKALKNIYKKVIHGAAGGSCAPAPPVEELFFQPAAVALIRFAESLPPVPRAVVFGGLAAR